MKELYILFIALLIQTNSEIIQNPIFLAESKKPFILSTNDNYYYIITIEKNLKIKKESGILENNTDNSAVEDHYIFIADNSYNNYVYFQVNIIRLYITHLFHMKKLNMTKDLIIMI